MAAGTAAQASLAALFAGLSVLAPVLRDDLGLSIGQIGAIFASVNLGMVVGLLPWGLAVDRAGERPVVVVGLAGAAAALAGAALVDGFPALFVLLFAAGALGSGVNSGSGRAVMRWFTQPERGLALGIRQTAIPAGSAVAAVTLPVLAAAGGLRAGLLALAVGCAAGSVAGLLLLEPSSGARPADGEPAGALRDSRLARLSLASALIVIAQIAAVGFLVLFLHEERGMSTMAAAAVLAVIQVGGAALRILTGVWSDRVGDRIGPLRRIAIAIAVSLGMATALTDAPLALLVPAFLVAGMLSMGWNVLSFAAAAELGGLRRSGAAIGVQQTALAVSAAVASVGFAAVAGVSWPLAFGLAAMCPLAGALLLGRGLDG